MIDEFSKVPLSCHIATYAEVMESSLDEEVAVDSYTQVVHSKLGRKVQLGRSNSILYSELGRYCYTGQNTTIRNAKLGKFNSISWNVSIGGNTHDMNKVTTHSFLVYPKWGMGGNSNWESVKQACSLGSDIWVGAGVNILRGVKIGSGAIIGAGTVITKDVPPYAVVVGNPGRIIRMRCPEEIIEKMLEIAWWDFPIEVIQDNFNIFESKLTQEIVHKLSEIKKQVNNRI